MLIARLIVGGIYVWFGINKVVDPVAFLKALREYEILPLSPPHWMNLTVIVLPWVEILCGALLIVGAMLRAAGVLLLGMTVVFTAAIAFRGLAETNALGIPFCDVGFDCGCGIGHVQVCDKLLENLGLIVLSVVVVLSRSRRLSLEGTRAATA
jgi:uncharacterized membrane protein YphA (DoxX/SURF4 family)